MDIRELLGLQTSDKIDQTKNVTLAFAVCFLWVLGVIAFLNFLRTPMNIGAILEPIQLGFEYPAKYKFFFSCILAPLWEESVWRLAAITIALRLSRSMDQDFVTPIVIISSMHFGWMHGHGPISLLIQGATGFILACVYLKNRNGYVSAVALHCAWNTMCFFAF